MAAEEAIPISEYRALRERFDDALLAFGRDITAAKTEIETLRDALRDIGTYAHCVALSGPANTPDLQTAWHKFNLISAKATTALIFRCPPTKS